MNSETDGAIWNERYATVGSLVIAVLVMIGGFVTTAVSFAVANEKRFSDNERQVAILVYQMQEIVRKNTEQDERMRQREAENRAAQEQELRMLTDINRQLAVHEAQSRGVGLRQHP